MVNPMCAFLRVQDAPGPFHILPSMSHGKNGNVWHTRPPRMPHGLVWHTSNTSGCGIRPAGYATPARMLDGIPNQRVATYGTQVCNTAGRNGDVNRRFIS